MPPKKMIYQLKISLLNCKPPIWRRILIPTSATFWDLHSAIQDVFHWNHSHLHQFLYHDKAVKKHLVFGIPSDADDLFEIEVLPSWKHKVSRYLNLEEPTIKYVYDLGDNWIHVIQLEKILLPQKDVTYPCCIKGKRNSPPDDCGGTWGYADMLEVLSNPDDPEYEDTTVWVESMKGGHFDPEHFDPSAVTFEDPKQRYDECFG